MTGVRLFPDDEYEGRKSILLRDIRAVEWSRQVPSFHLNTKLWHLVVEGCPNSVGWTEGCEKFVSCLPPILSVCGWRNEAVDPFRGAREAFPSNRSGGIHEIFVHACHMWNAAKSNPSTSHTGLHHGNLIEILEMSGVLPQGEARRFYRDILGLDSTPAEEIEELVMECEGDSMLCGTEIRRTGSGVFFQRSGGNNILWEESTDGVHLSMEGHGCICRWRVLHEDGVAVVIQSSDAVHTSVTNLAEHVRDACRRRFGAGTVCHEFYEPGKGEPMSLPCEITGAEGETAGWIPVDIESLPGLEEWLRIREVDSTRNAT